MWAASEGGAEHLELARWLVSEGADVRCAMASSGKTALMLALALPVQFGCGLVFHRDTWHCLRTPGRSLNMSVLITLGTFVAFFFGLGRGR